MASDQALVLSGIAQRVRAERTRRRWTLDELAHRSAVSRRLLVQIEQGTANPSLSTLLKLAAALGITLSDLLDAREPAPPVVVVPDDESRTLWQTAAGSAATLLVSQGPLELWSWTLAAGDRRTSDPHRAGSVELLSVHSGAVVLDVGGDRVEVVAGDSARFEATWPHSYSNAGPAPATFTLVVLEPAGDG